MNQESGDSLVALVDRARLGDRNACAALCDTLRFRLCAYLSRRLHDPDAVADAVQETLVRMLFALACGTIRAADRFEGWVFATARNVSADAWRDPFRRRASVDLTVAEAAVESTPWSADLRAAVVDAVDWLPQKLRHVTRLRYWEQLTCRKIASRLGISENAVGLRLLRSRRLLACRLQHLR